MDAQEEMRFHNFVSVFLQDLLKFHGARFKTYDASLQQQIQYLSVVAGVVVEHGLVKLILDEHNIVQVSKNPILILIRHNKTIKIALKIITCFRRIWIVVLPHGKVLTTSRNGNKIWQLSCSY